MGGKTTTKTSYDPAMQALVTGNVTRAQGVADAIRPYEGKLTAEQSPLMGQYFDAANAIQGAGQQYLGEAAGAARGALGYTPQMVSPQQMQAASAGQAATVDPAQALGLLGNAATASGFDRSQINDVNLGQLGRSQIEALFNPFEDTKVQSALGDYERARQMQQNADAAKFGSGAWGGSRQGVEASLTNDAYQRNSQNAANDLRYQGWNSALNGALTARGQDLQAAMANQGADLAAAQSAAQASQFNAGQKNAMGQYGAGLLGQLQSFNAGQSNTRAENEATRAQDAGRTNVNNNLAAALANQGAGLQGAGLQLQGGSLLGNLAGQDVSRALGLTGLLGTAAGAQQTLSQDELDRLANNYQQGITNSLNAQNVVNSATGLVPSVTNQTQTTKQSGGLGGALGLLGTLAMGAATGGASLGLSGLGGAASSLGGLGAAGLGSFVPSLSSLGSSSLGMGLNLPSFLTSPRSSTGGLGFTF